MCAICQHKLHMAFSVTVSITGSALQHARNEQQNSHNSFSMGSMYLLICHGMHVTMAGSAYNTPLLSGHGQSVTLLSVVPITVCLNMQFF